jgi:hypothetical protein
MCRIKGLTEEPVRLNACGHPSVTEMGMPRCILLVSIAESSSSASRLGLSVTTPPPLQISQCPTSSQCGCLDCSAVDQITDACPPHMQPVAHRLSSDFPPHQLHPASQQEALHQPLRAVPPLDHSFWNAAQIRMCGHTSHPSATAGRVCAATLCRITSRTSPGADSPAASCRAAMRTLHMHLVL